MPCGCLSCQNRDNLRVFVKTPLKYGQKRQQLNIRFQISLPQFLTKPTGVGPHFDSASRQVSLGSQARKEFPRFRRSRGQSLNWRLSPSVSPVSFPGQNANKLVVLWNSLEQPKGLQGPQDGERESSAITGQTGCLGMFSLNSLY